MAAKCKEKVLDLFTCENGSFSLHEIMDRLEIKSNAIVNVAIFELVREGVLTQTSEMPPKWEFTRAQSETETEKNCVGERSDEGKLFCSKLPLKKYTIRYRKRSAAILISLQNHNHCCYRRPYCGKRMRCTAVIHETPFCVSGRRVVRNQNSCGE